MSSTENINFDKTICNLAQIESIKPSTVSSLVTLILPSKFYF
jgi:hypothetical protein